MSMNTTCELEGVEQHISTQDFGQKLEQKRSQALTPGELLLVEPFRSYQISARQEEN